MSLISEKKLNFLPPYSSILYKWARKVADNRYLIHSIGFLQASFIFQFSMDPTTLQQVPEEHKEIYIRNWNTIKPSVRQGLIKDVYHSPLFSNSNDEIKSRFQETVVKYTTKIKINVAFGFVLRNRRTDELRFFHPSNKTMLFDTPKLLVNINERKKTRG